jgi:hypothetical protein
MLNWECVYFMPQGGEEKIEKLDFGLSVFYGCGWVPSPTKINYLMDAYTSLNIPGGRVKQKRKDKGSKALYGTGEPRRMRA